MEKIIALATGEHIDYDSLLNKLATELFVVTSYETTTNNWTFDFEELEQKYELPNGFIESNADNISGRVNALFNNIVAEIYYCDNRFDVTLYENFCTGYIFDDQSIQENRTDDN